MSGQSKKMKKLKKLHGWLDKKVNQLTEDRKKDRSQESKTVLVRLKKQKLTIKDAITELTKKEIMSLKGYVGEQIAKVMPQPDKIAEAMQGGFTNESS